MKGKGKKNIKITNDFRFFDKILGSFGYGQSIDGSRFFFQKFIKKFVKLACEVSFNNVIGRDILDSANQSTDLDVIFK